MDAIDQLKQQSLSNLKDPFKVDKIQSVGINISTGIMGNKYCWGYVEFKNGNTEGRQKFENGTDFNALVKEIQAFIETLEK
jgi:hypothetical protein